MNADEGLKLEYELALPGEYSIEDLKAAIIEFAREDDQASDLFKDENFKIKKEPGEYFELETMIVTVVIAFLSDVARDLAKDAVKSMIKKIIPKLQARFGLDVLSEKN